MNSEWDSVEIGAVAKLRSGFPFKSADWTDEGVPVIKIANVKNGRIVRDGCGFVAPELAQRTPEWFTKDGDVLIAMTGYVGEVALVQTGEQYLINQRVGRFEFHTGAAVDPKFFFYHLQLPATRSEIEGVARGSAQPNLSAADAHKIKLTLPPVAIQKEISGILGVLDDRITLLRETNTTLEAIAQALFKSWFVDFDPVHAKMQGRVPEGMDEATAALFPDSFEDSELGPVPKGWSVGSVSDFARLKKGTVNPGSQPDIVFEHFSLPAFDDGQNPVIEFGASIKSNKTPVPEDAVLLSKLNPHIPRIWLPVNAGRNAVCSTEFLAFQPTGVGSRELIYCLFSSPDFISRLQQLVTGTSNSHQRIKPDQIALMTSVVPAASVASAFEILTRPIFERVHANRQNVQTLSAIRDVILPRLISGQLRVSEALTEMDGV